MPILTCFGGPHKRCCKYFRQIQNRNWLRPKRRLHAWSFHLQLTIAAGQGQRGGAKFPNTRTDSGEMSSVGKTLQDGAQVICCLSQQNFCCYKQVQNQLIFLPLKSLASVNIKPRLELWHTKRFCFQFKIAKWLYLNGVEQFLQVRDKLM